MRMYEIRYKDGKVIIDSANTPLEIVKKYDLASRANASVKVKELTDET